MSPHTIETARERAALYAAGALGDAEQRELEAHLRDGCALCQAEVDAFSTVGNLLAESVARRHPRPQLRRLVDDAVAHIAAAPSRLEKDGVCFVRSDQLDWQTSPGGTVQIKPLHHDPQRGYHTVLVRMRPGDTYPSHRHAGAEEVFLIEGDVTLNGVTMRAGDYCRAEAGSIHGELSTEQGCTFMVIASLHDEIVAD